MVLKQWFQCKHCKSTAKTKRSLGIHYAQKHFDLICAKKTKRKNRSGYSVMNPKKDLDTPQEKMINLGPPLKSFRFTSKPNRYPSSLNEEGKKDLKKIIIR